MPEWNLAYVSRTDNSTNVNALAMPAVASRWGHAQISGSIREWVYDEDEAGWYAGAGTDCDDCYNVDDDRAKRTGTRALSGPIQEDWATRRQRDPSSLRYETSLN